MAKKAATKKKAKAKGESAAATKKVAKTAKKKTVKRKTRAKKDVEVRLQLFWGVFNHAMKPIARYAYNQKKAAEKKAGELSAGGKPQHFVMKIKEPVEDA